MQIELAVKNCVKVVSNQPNFDVNLFKQVITQIFYDNNLMLPIKLQGFQFSELKELSNQLSSNSKKFRTTISSVPEGVLASIYSSQALESRNNHAKSSLKKVGITCPVQKLQIEKCFSELNLQLRVEPKKVLLALFDYIANISHLEEKSIEHKGQKISRTIEMDIVKDVLTLFSLCGGKLTFGENGTAARLIEELLKAIKGGYPSNMKPYFNNLYDGKIEELKQKIEDNKNLLKERFLREH